MFADEATDFAFFLSNAPGIELHKRISWGASKGLIALLSTICLITSFDLEYHADK
jgi:hypothetical protein